MRKFKISQIPVIDINGFVGSVDESDLFQSYVSDKNVADKPIKEVMGKPYPIVKLGTPIEEVSKLFTKDNQAVLVDLGNGKHHIITKYDIIGSIKQKLKDKNIYIIAGCNGAGKTTASYTILPEILNCKEFVNADEIARGLSPFRPESVAFEAGRIMLSRIEQLFAENQSFAIETTLATKKYRNKMIEARSKGYEVILLFFWLESAKMAIDRVRTRVEEGGHNIPENVIIQRYFSGIRNLFDLYIDIVDQLIVFDSSDTLPKTIAFKSKGTDFTVNHAEKFNKLKDIYHGS